MKILYICADRGIPILGHKGASVHVRSISEAFARAGHQVTIVAPTLTKQKREPHELVYPQGVEVRRIKSASYVSADLPSEQAKEARSIAYSDYLADALSAEIGEYDLIYERYSLWSDVGARLATVSGLPFVLEVNAPLRQEAAAFRHLFASAEAERIERTQFAAADRVAVVSAELKQYVIDQGGNRTAVCVLPNAVDPQQFHPAVRGGKLRDRYGLHGKQVVGFVGRVRPWHDIDTLIAAFARCYADNPNLHLLLVGQTDAALQTKLDNLGLQSAATLTGAIPHPMIPAHIAAMDVAVSSHVASTDSYFSPLKLYEYLACGVPTVAANVGQTGRLIEDRQTGFLYKAGDSAELARAIQHVFREPVEARRVAWQGATLILNRYTWDNNAAHLLSGYAAPTVTAANDLPLLDAKLRQRLYRATRHDLAVRFFKTGLASSLRVKQVKQIDLLKYKPNRRCVLAYTVRGWDTVTNRSRSLPFVGKVFRDGRGELLNRWQSLLWDGAFRPDSADQITVAAPLGYLAPMRMQVQGWADGKTFDELAHERRHDMVPLAARSAEAIAKLHSWQPPNDAPTLKTYALADEVGNLAHYAERTIDLRPDMVVEVEALHSTLVDWSGRLPAPTRRAVLHRDFYYSQLLFDGDDVTLIDFDLLALGDRAIDVANFVAHLSLLGLQVAGRVDWFSAESHAFRRQYPRFATIDATFQERCNFYEATTLFRLLQVVLTRPKYADHFETLFHHTAAKILGVALAR